MIMPERSDKQTVTIVTACMGADGLPTFALTEVAVTQEELDNGAHYYLAEAILLHRGYEEPYVHFDQTESPEFLHPAVRRYLGYSPEATSSSRLKEGQCPASSK